MLIDKKHDEELARRKGLANRTLVATVWLMASVIIAMLITLVLTTVLPGMEFFYETLGIPATVNANVIRLVSVVVIIFLMQLLAIIGFALTSPEAKARTGMPMAYTQGQDYGEGSYYH